MSNIQVTLPDGSVRSVPMGAHALDVARSISPRLADDAIVARVNGDLWDLNRPFEADAKLQILTPKNPESLEVYRHSTAHLLAAAVLELYPETKLGIGPPIENGFYYDFDRATPFTPEDLEKIEKKMWEIQQRNLPYDRVYTKKDEGLRKYSDAWMKCELITERAGEIFTEYTLGPQFIDFCRGPHLPSTSKIKAFKLLSVAGAYWKGDEHNKQLQRIYGTAFFSQKDLDEYLKQIEEAKKRDHRVLGKHLKLFTISQQVGSGLILWIPKGATVRGILENFIRDELVKRGYEPVYTPHIGRLELYRTSGHFPYYRDAQFPPMYHRPAAGTLDLCQYRLQMGEVDEKREHDYVEYMKQAHMLPPEYIKETSQAAKLEMIHQFVLVLLKDLHVDLPEYHRATNYKDRADALLKWLMDQEGFLLKPMNCPHHIHIYKAEPRSYRDLPVRLAEFGTVYRYEQTGELNGMTSVRGFTQDDAHLFITPEQVESELRAHIELVLFIFRT